VSEKFGLRDALWLTILLLIGVHVAEAQQPKKIPRIGYLSLTSGPGWQEEEFLKGLHDLGYVERQNIIVEYRWAAGKMDRLPALAEELVRLKVELVIGRTTPVIQALKSATTTIPILMLAAADPVRTGLVASLARPGGNITGMSAIMPEVTGKRLELLRELVPQLSAVAFLLHGGDPIYPTYLEEAKEESKKLRMQIRPVVIGGPEEIEDAFAAMIKERAGALIVHALFINTLRQGKRIANLAVKYHLPTISDGIPFAEEGGLIFYGPDARPLLRQAATYVDKILKGAKPADLPVEQPTKFELVINLKAAKQIGLIIPPNVLARADRVFR
jgi:putative ABC transport system substrate-binding protein